MKKTNVGLASVLAASMLLTGCGLTFGEDGVENINVSELIDDAYTIFNNINGTPHTEPVVENEDDAEMKEVQAVVDRYIQAVKDGDAQGIADSSDLAMVTYIFSGKEPSMEELLEQGQQALENVGANFSAGSSLEFTADELTCHNSEAGMINGYLTNGMLNSVQSAPKDISDKYQIDGAYSFNLTIRTNETEYAGNYGGDEEWNTETEEYTSDEIIIDMDSVYSAVQDMTRNVPNISLETYVLRINGEWRVDAGQFVTVAKMYNLLQSFAQKN